MSLLTLKNYSKNSGVVLNKIDGLENVYDFSVIDSIDEKDFNFDNANNTSNYLLFLFRQYLKYYFRLQ